MKASLAGGLAAFLLMGLASCATAPEPSARPSAGPVVQAPSWRDFDWAAASGPGKPESPDGLWTGIFQEATPNDQALRTELEEVLGRKFAVQMWFADYSTGFPTESAEAAWKAGTVPSITWEPWLWSDKEKIHLADLIEGRWDQYISDWGRAAAAFGKPVFVRWGHEFNGNWYPWAVSQNGEDPKLYIQAYRRVHDLVTAAGARNILWVWCPNASSVPATTWNAALRAYPGDSYVDWVALDGYDFDGIMSFSDIFGRIYTDVVQEIAKPVYIGEFATGRTGAAKAQWIAAMDEALAAKFPAIKGLVWFNVKKERDWRLEDSNESIEAAAKVFGRPVYHSRPDSIPALAQAFERNLAQYRAKSAALTAVARNQVAVPQVLKDAAGAVDWTTAAALEVKSAKGPYGFVRLAWDSASLYLRLENTTGLKPQNLQTADGIWNGDGLEFCLSTNPAAVPTRGYFDATDWQLGFSPGDGTPNRSPRSWEWSKLKSQVPGALVTSRITDTGWVLEATVPWSAFRGFQPQSGMVLGFDTAVDQAGPDGARAYQWIWNGNADFYNNPAQWGTLLLQG